MTDSGDYTYTPPRGEIFLPTRELERQTRAVEALALLLAEQTRRTNRVLITHAHLRQRLARVIARARAYRAAAR